MKNVPFASFGSFSIQKTEFYRDPKMLCSFCWLKMNQFEIYQSSLGLMELRILETRLKFDASINFINIKHLKCL